MGMYRPLRGILFLYECVRFSALVWAVGLTTGEGAAFPVLVYGVANALFLLMALFVRLDPIRYGVYVPLYTAGKVIAAVAVLGWCVFSREQIVNAVFMSDDSMLTALGLLICIGLGDILSVCGGAVLNRRLKRGEAVLPPEAAEPAAIKPVEYEL
ncbi:hypothetical protein FACS1894109_01580 [Spirochaetia bacterium]|nr:hypothetical protein FACS1894109_01580 [Spirochaetia bacterium]